ncbi:MAG: TonB-dependent receptor, partial [bacterium]
MQIERINVIILVIFLYSCTALYSQNSSILHGFVLDEDNGEALFGANIIVVGTGLGCAADSNGYFYMSNIPAGKYDIQVMRIGYETQIIRDIFLKPGEKRKINFKLSTMVLLMKPVQVEAERISDKYHTEVEQIGLQKINPGELKTMPGAFDDLTRAVQVLKSAIPVSDFNSFFAIRGGSPDQNLIVMDGVIIPNPYRFRLALGGGMSIFDPNITEEVRLHVGGFSAKFGNLLSSVLEVDTRAGNFQHFSIKSSFNLLDAGIVMEGPLFKSRCSWLLSARRTYYDLFAPRFIKTNSTFPNSSDINAKFVYNVTPNLQFSVRLMRSEENAEFLEEFAENTNLTENAQIRLISINLKQVSTPKLHFQTSISYCRDDWQFDSFYSFYSHYYDSTMNYSTEKLKATAAKFSFREDFEYQLSNKIWFRRGFYISSIHPDIEYYIEQSPIILIGREIPSSLTYHRRENYIAGYIEVVAQINRRLQTQV